MPSGSQLRDTEVNLGEHHIFSGNPMRASTGWMPVRLDTEWQTQLPPVDNWQRSRRSRGRCCVSIAIRRCRRREGREVVALHRVSISSSWPSSIWHCDFSLLGSPAQGQVSAPAYAPCIAQGPCTTPSRRARSSSSGRVIDRYLHPHCPLDPKHVCADGVRARFEGILRPSHRSVGRESWPWSDTAPRPSHSQRSDRAAHRHLCDVHASIVHAAHTRSVLRVGSPC